jgi:hypothetical protein
MAEGDEPHARLRLLRGRGDKAGRFDLAGAVSLGHGGMSRVVQASVSGVILEHGHLD